MPTLKSIIELLPAKTYLYYVDRNDSLNESGEVLKECLNEKSIVPLDEKIFEWFDGYEGIDYYFDELKKDLCNKFDLDESGAQEIIDLNIDEIRDELYNRDESDVLKDLARNTSDITLRITLFSNYEGIEPPYLSGCYSYDSYLQTLCEALNLNPYLLKKALNEKGFETMGLFPNKTSRNGKEVIKYDDFANELREAFSYSQFVFAVKMDCREFLEFIRNGAKSLELPVGVRCGLHSSWEGSTSIMDCETIREFEVSFEKEYLTKYDNFDICLDDDGDGYGINNVCGVTRDFFTTI